MTESVHNLSVAIGHLPLGTRPALKWLCAHGFSSVQLSAIAPDMRPRDLDKSARRDLAAALRRLELRCSGLDMFIPPQHFSDPGQADRAVAAVVAGIELAADLGRVPVSLVLPVDIEPAIVAGLGEAAQHSGIQLANHAIADEGADGLIGIGIGVDPAACLASGRDPADSILSAGPALVAARLSDISSEGLRVPLGENGRLDLRSYAATLAAVEYARPLIIDPLQWADPSGGIESARAVWRGITPSVG